MNSKLEATLKLLERNNPPLTSLDLGYNWRITSESAHLLSEALIQNSSLTSLNLRGNNFNPFKRVRPLDVRPLRKALIQNSSLTSLNLGGNNISSRGILLLSEALIQNSYLTSLNLRGNNINSEGILHLSKALIQNSYLTSLNLRGNNINSEGILHLSKALIQNSYLTSLNLRGNNINSEGILHLSEALIQNSSLTSLNLKHNNINSEDTLHLSEALIQNLFLTSLNLRSNNIGPVGYLWKALIQNHTLTFLDLENNLIDFVGARYLSKALEQNHSLTILNLNMNNIGSKVHPLSEALMRNNDDFIGARYLSDALIQNQTLTILNLNTNDIASNGARCLSKALMQNHSLTSLDLGNNLIDFIGAAYLSEALMRNHSLTTLNLNSNSIGSKGACSLSKALMQNYSITSLNLGNNHINKSKKQLAAIRKNLSQNAVIHSMMSHPADLAEEQKNQAKITLNTLGLGAIYLSNEPLAPKIRPFFHSLLTNLTRNSHHKPYTVMILPFSYAREINLLRIFSPIDSSDDTLWLSKEGFCFSLVELIDDKVMENPYICPEWNVFFDRKVKIKSDQNWIGRLSYVVESLIETLGFLPHLSFQYSGLNSKDLRDLLTYLATDPPIEHLDLSHNPIMLKKWNRPKTQKMISPNSVFNHLRQLTGNTQLRHLDLSHTQITLDQQDYPKLLPIFNEQPNLVVDLSGNYVSSYMRWKLNGEKEKTSKVLCRFFQGLPPENERSMNDPFNNFFRDLRFERTEPFGNGFFQAIAFCLRQDEKVLKKSFKAFVLEHVSKWQNDLGRACSVENYLRQLKDDELPLPHTLTLMSHFLDAPLVILSSESAPMILNENEDPSGNPLFLYQDEEQRHHALTYEEDFDAKDLLTRLVTIIQNGVSVFYDRWRTQSEYLELHHGFWSERKPLASIFSVLPKHEGLTLNDHTQRHVALCCQRSITGGHTWLIIEGMHHFGQAFFLCADLTTNDNRTTQINIHAEFCPHRFKEGLLKGTIIARVYPDQPKEKIKALRRRVEEEHERNHYRYGSTGASNLITSNQQVRAQLLSEEEQRAKVLNCMQWAIELLVDHDIIDQKEASALSGNVMRYWPINVKENTACCVM